MRELGELDAFDLRILVALQENGRLTNQELGERVGLSASQCSRRRTSLEAAGLIRGYRADLAAERVGFRLLVFVEVTLATRSGDNAEKFRKLVTIGRSAGGLRHKRRHRLLPEDRRSRPKRLVGPAERNSAPA